VSTGRDRHHVAPGRMLLQWHITERCNLRCGHCYQDRFEGPELSARQLIGVVDQFRDLVLARTSADAPPGPPPGDRSCRPVRGWINVTGGEPFLRPDCLLELLSRERDWLGFGVLTNGTLIDDRLARYLAELGPGFVQVSLDGVEATHDAARGPGSFRRAVAGIRRLGRAGVRTMISFTARRDNWPEFSKVVRLGRRLGVAKVWTDRFLPFGGGADWSHKTLAPAETRDYVRLVARARRNSARRPFSATTVEARRGLQFLGTRGPAYACAAGDRLVTVLADGGLTPCRRLPILIGNVLETPLLSLYAHSPVLADLRDPDRVPAACRDCPHVTTCRGGLRCLAYAVTNDPFAPDPGCWLAAGG
jgi:radical SAM protein with 4Fe4S-binding SPASM domain